MAKSSIRDGDFAFTTNITLESFSTDFTLGQSQHLRAYYYNQAFMLAAS
jgi:uncharacterized protein (DUF2164 family)